MLSAVLAILTIQATGTQALPQAISTLKPSTALATSALPLYAEGTQSFLKVVWTSASSLNPLCVVSGLVVILVVFFGIVDEVVGAAAAGICIRLGLDITGGHDRGSVRY